MRTNRYGFFIVQLWHFFARKLPKHLLTVSSVALDSKLLCKLVASLRHANCVNGNAAIAESS